MTELTAGLDRIALALLNRESDAVIATDLAGDITFWGAGAQRIFGYDAAAALGQSLDLIIPERLREAHWRGYHEVMRTGVSRYGSDRLLSVPATTADGRRISVEFTIALVTSAEGEITGTVAVLRDVTAQFEELKALRRANR